MRSLLPILLLLALQPMVANADPVDVELAFETYRQSLLIGDGEAAADVVTDASHAYYRSLADDALQLDRQGLNRLHVSERMSVLLLRHSLEPKALATMSGRELVAYAVERGWIGKDSVAEIRLGQIEIDGSLASAAVIGSDGKESPFSFKFRKEEGDWRLDLAGLLAIVRVVMEILVQRTGMTEEQFILHALEFSTGRQPGPEIWSPPQ